MKINSIRKKVLPVILILVLSIALTACSNAAEPSTPAAEPTQAMAAEEPTFMLEELAMYDGQDGNPAYIAIDGIVYEVTDVSQWSGGKHNGYTAGQDLTEEMQSAPHGFSKLSGLTAVGVLAE